MAQPPIRLYQAKRPESNIPLANDFPQKQITWFILRPDPKLWANLHLVKQLERYHVLSDGKIIAIGCVYVNDEGFQFQARFGTLKEMRHHLYTFHFVKTYVCLFCRSAYAFKRYLLTHCKSRHDGRLGEFWLGHNDDV